MKVCLINTYDSTGGAAIACRRLMHALNRSSDIQANMLVAAGNTVDPDVIRLDNSLLHKWQFRINLVYERLQFKPYHNREINEFYFSLADTGIDVSAHPAVLEADIIHLHWINLGFISISGIRKLAALGKPVVWTLHDMWAFTGGCHYSGTCLNFRSGCGNCMFLRSPGADDLSARYNRRKVFFKDLHFVACSQWLADEASHSSLLYEADVRSIRNPINLDEYSPGDCLEARTFHGLDPEIPYILFAAANLDDERKGFRYLADSLQYLPDMLKKMPGRKPELLLFGKNTLEDGALPLKVNSLGPLSSTEAIVKAYRAAALFVIPSLQDNLPNTIAEAMACGIPVVGFNSGGIPEMIDHCINGYVARLSDARDLAEGMALVLSHPEFGKSARRKAEADYDPGHIAAQYSELYKSLLPGT